MGLAFISCFLLGLSKTHAMVSHGMDGGYVYLDPKITC
jgi:hypothetical protein